MLRGGNVTCSAAAWEARIVHPVFPNYEKDRNISHATGKCSIIRSDSVLTHSSEYADRKVARFSCHFVKNSLFALTKI